MLRSTASHYYITSKQKPFLPLLFIIIIRSDWVTCLQWSVQMYKYKYLLDAEYLDCYYVGRPWLRTDTNLPILLLFYHIWSIISDDQFSRNRRINLTKLNLNPVSLTSKLSEEYEYKEGIQIYINPLLMSDHQHCKKNQTFISTNQTFLCALRPFTASLNIIYR